jgi:AraC family transcriptional regulator
MAKIKVKKVKQMKLAYIEHKGPYDQVPFDEYYAELYGWVKEQKGVHPGFKPLAVYPDDPKATAPEQLRTQVAVPIVGDAKEDDTIKIMEMPAMECAVLEFKGSPEEYGNAYKELAAWTEQNGYDWAAPPFELHTKKPKTKDGKCTMFSKIHAPIKKK